MRTSIAIPAFTFLGLVLSGAATAQVTVEPGTEFPAAPISKGGISLSAPSQPIAAAPAPGPVVAPAPEPVKKRRRRRRS